MNWTKELFKFLIMLLYMFAGVLIAKRNWWWLLIIAIGSIFFMFYEMEARK